VGNLHLRFDEGRVGRSLERLSLTLLLYRLGNRLNLQSRARKQAVSWVVQLILGHYTSTGTRIAFCR
jgi:hypothetical protein